MENRRHYKRIKFETESNLTINDTSYHCELLDLALKGALLQTSEELPLADGESCRINIFLPASNIALRFEGQLVHRRGDLLGFKFLTVDIETLMHLRRLLELNIGDGDEVSREFDYWLSSLS